MNPNYKVVVTGAAGYIGLPLTKMLAKKYNVLGLDRIKKPAEWPSSASYFQCQLDTVSPGDLQLYLQGASAVFHLAAARTDWGLTEKEYWRDNVAATETLLEAGRNSDVSEWLHFSTVGVVGPSSDAIDESASYSPSGIYGITKVAAEKEFIEFAHAEGRVVKIIRPSAVFSEEQPSNTNIYRLINALYRRRFIQIGSGDEVKTTSYLENLLAAVIWLHEIKGNQRVRIYNYVDEPKLKTREMVDIISHELDIRRPYLRIPLALTLGPAHLADILAKQIRRDLPITAARIKKFCTATNFDGSQIRFAGFQPLYDSEDALRRTARWYKERVNG